MLHSIWTIIRITVEQRILDNRLRFMSDQVHVLTVHIPIALFFQSCGIGEGEWLGGIGGDFRGVEVFRRCIGLWIEVVEPDDAHWVATQLYLLLLNRIVNV